MPKVCRICPPEELRRFAFKLATGSGKDVGDRNGDCLVLFPQESGMAGSEMSTNFTDRGTEQVIVYQRLERGLRQQPDFSRPTLIPPEWRPFEPKIILRGDSYKSRIHQETCS